MKTDSERLARLEVMVAELQRRMVAFEADSREEITQQEAVELVDAAFDVASKESRADAPVRG